MAGGAGPTHAGTVAYIYLPISGFAFTSRTQLGGNLALKEFMKSYEPADQGGFKDGASPYDTYHCWAAAQYREKVCPPDIPFERVINVY